MSKSTISTFELFQMFPDAEAAAYMRSWLAETPAKLWRETFWKASGQATKAVAMLEEIGAAEAEQAA